MRRAGDRGRSRAPPSCCVLALAGPAAAPGPGRLHARSRTRSTASRRSTCSTRSGRRARTLELRRRRHATPTTRRPRRRSTSCPTAVLAIDGRERAGGAVHRRRTGPSRCITYVMNGGANDLRNQDIVREIRTRGRAGSVRWARPGRAGLRRAATPRTRSTSSTFYTQRHAAGHRVRPRPVVPAAARRLPLDRHPDQGDPAEPALDRRRVRPARVGLPGGPRLGPARLQARPDRGVRPGLHLHDPVRALDGLPRLHPDPDQGGPGPGHVARTRRSPAGSRSRRARSRARPRSWSWSSACS